MISIEDLNNSFYAKNLFSLHKGKVVVTEKKNLGLEGKLQKVTLLTDGDFIELSNSYLQKTCEVFKKVSGKFSFKQDCDGIFLLNKGEKQYFIVVELKSGFDTKAFCQIASSYIRCKAMLRNISTYDSSRNYAEKAFLISYEDDYQKYDAISNSKVLASKKLMADSSMGDVLNSFRVQIKKKGKVIVNPSDFHLESMSIPSDLLMKNLEIVGVEIKRGICEENIQLDSLL